MYVFNVSVLPSWRIKIYIYSRLLKKSHSSIIPIYTN